MKSKQGLMAALVGIAMIAMPITATAGDHGRRGRSYEGTRFMGPPVAGGRDHCELRHDNGNHFGWYKHHERDNYRNYNAGYACDDDGDDCRPVGQGYRPTGYGYQTMAPAYAVPVTYQTPYYGSGYSASLINPNLGGAQNLMAAKAQAQAQLQVALRSGNRGAIRAARRNLYAIDRQIARMNVRATGVPYARYGSNYSQPPLHKRLLNGLLGGTGYNTAPVYGNVPAYNNYNGGAIPGVAAYQNYGAAPVAPAYGTPYAGGATSMLAPLLQSFVP